MRRHLFAAAVLLVSLSGTSGRGDFQPANATAQPAVDPTAQLLADLIRIDTSNPPGHEQRIAEYLAPKLAALGFQIEIVPTPEAGKAALFARLKGDGTR